MDDIHRWGWQMTDMDRAIILSQELKGICLWISYNLDDGTNGSWVEIASFRECIGLRISKCALKFHMIWYYECYWTKIASFDFTSFLGELLVLKGMLYLFVEPNEELVLALSLDTHQDGNIHVNKHMTHLSNVTTLKAVIPFYS